MDDIIQISQLEEMTVDKLTNDDVFPLAQTTAYDAYKATLGDFDIFIKTSPSSSKIFAGKIDTASFATMSLTTSYASGSGVYAISSSYAYSSSYSLSGSYSDKSISSSYTSKASTVIDPYTHVPIKYSDTASYLIYTPGVFNGSASYAISASTTRTASFSTNASYALSASYAKSASYALSASYAKSTSYAKSASYALSASYASSSSYVLNSDTILSASRAITASYALSSSYATSASNGINSEYSLSSSYSTSASYADSASYSRTCSYAETLNPDIFGVNPISKVVAWGYYNGGIQAGYNFSSGTTGRINFRRNVGNNYCAIVTCKLSVTGAFMVKISNKSNSGFDFTPYVLTKDSYTPVSTDPIVYTPAELVEGPVPPGYYYVIFSDSSIRLVSGMPADGSEIIYTGFGAVKYHGDRNTALPIYLGVTTTVTSYQFVVYSL